MNRFKPDNPMRRRIVFFEGLDKAGKSLLCRKARFASGHEVLMFDRGIIGRRVFAQFRKETDFPIVDWGHLEAMLIKDNAYAVVFLEVSPKESYARQLAAGETPEFTVEQLRQQRELYRREIWNLKQAGHPLLVIDTERHTVDSALRKLLTWIKGGKEWISETI